MKEVDCVCCELEGEPTCVYSVFIGLLDGDVDGEELRCGVVV